MNDANHRLPDRPPSLDRRRADGIPALDVAQIERRAWPRRASDRALQHLASLVTCLEHMGDGVIVLDPYLRIVHLTDSARRLLETGKQYISVQHQHLILAAPDQARRLRQFAESVLSSDGFCSGGGN